MENILAGFRRYLEDVEYSRVEDQPGNVAQVDELVRILLTKEDRHFYGLCGVLERSGYRHWGEKLRADAYASGRKESEGKRAELNRKHACTSRT